MERLISLVGLVTMVLIAWLLSNNRKKINYRTVVGGLALQFLLALFILKTDIGIAIFDAARDAIQGVISLSNTGAEFVFGKEFREHFFAFSVLPTIIFMSSLSYILFYWRVLPRVVEFLARIMVKVMNISGAESLCAAANVFIGQTEAPLLVRPYLKTMTQSEILTMMCSGMATVAGGVLAAYVAFGIPAGHLLAASIMAAPASIVMAKLIFPETENSPTMGHVKIQLESNESNFLEAACNGASEGMKLALNVAAMLIAFISLVALLNLVVGGIGSWVGMEWSIEGLLSLMFRPLAFLMGVPWEEAGVVGRLLGEKVVINEFYAYINLGKFIDSATLSPRAVSITTYALCGFANFSSIAIQIGGIGALAPERKSDFAKLGFRAFLGGNLAAFTNACIAGLLL